MRMRAGSKRQGEMQIRIKVVSYKLFLRTYIYSIQYNNISILSHQIGCRKILINQQFFHPLAHVNLLLLLFTQPLHHLACLNIQLFAHVTKTFHLHRGLLSIAISPLDGRLPDHRNRGQVEFVVGDQSGDQYGCIGSQLKIPQMPNVLEKFTNRSRPITRWMITQNTPKYQGSPIFVGTQLLLPSHIEHANRLSQIMQGGQVNHAFRDQLAFSVACFLELFEKDVQVFIILLLMNSFVFIDGLPIGDGQVTGSALQILLHLKVLVQAPRIQVLLHVLHHNEGCVGWTCFRS